MVDARGYFGGDRGVGGGEPASKRGEARLLITLVAFRCHRRRRSSSKRATSSHVQVVWLSLPKFVFFFLSGWSINRRIFCSVAWSSVTLSAFRGKAVHRYSMRTQWVSPTCFPHMGVLRFSVHSLVRPPT